MSESVIIIVLIISLIVGGFVYWKRRDLFGKKKGGKCKKDIDCKSKLTCNTLKKCTDIKTVGLGQACSNVAVCETPLVCDASVCQYQQSIINCTGSWLEWSNCEGLCNSEGIQQRTFHITTHAQNGGTECAYAAGNIETKSCTMPNCTSGNVINEAPVTANIIYKYTGYDYNEQIGLDVANINFNMYFGRMSDSTQASAIQTCMANIECGSFTRNRTSKTAWFKKPFDLTKTGYGFQQRNNINLYSKTSIPELSANVEIIYT